MTAGCSGCSCFSTSTQTGTLDVAPNATGTLFITTSPAYSTRSPSTNTMVSPGVCVEPSARSFARTPPRSTVYSRSNSTSALRTGASFSISPMPGEKLANRFVRSGPSSSRSFCCCREMTNVVPAGNAEMPATCSA